MSRAPYVEREGAGASVVLLHSSGMSGRQWRRLAGDLVARGFRAVVPDLAGHGQSPGWPELDPLTFAVDVDDVGALVDGEGAPVDLVGHSYGGLIALLVALARPERVRSLALYDPVAFGVLGADDADARADLDAVPSPWEDTPTGRERWLEAFVEFWGGQGAWQTLRPEARGEFVRVAWPLYQGVTSLVRDTTAASAYAAIGAPVLLMTGEHTPRAERRVVERLGASFPRGRVEVIAGAGHMGPLTHARAVNDAILGFLAAR
ncbi:MAG TPA: alpha/beta hydrolase [Polyangiaceae bacterium]|jgi:pimeloyl-ACP methyl ester carboxylesterase|nr:alpha/beta hydrolase [Polyangiaceae bacterium]